MATTTVLNADSALKTLYLGVITEQLNTSINPLLARIKQTTSDVWGKDVKRLVQYGINGGVGAGSEDGALPSAAGNSYTQLTSTLKNLYGTIEISDKAIRASENNTGAFVNLLNAEMEGLLKAATYNFGRMLYGDGTGVLASVTSYNSGMVKVNNTKNITEGMVVDFRQAGGGAIEGATGKRILSVDRTTNTVVVSGAVMPNGTLVEGNIMTLQGSYQQELTGLGAIFKSTGGLYGLNRASNKWMIPHMRSDVGEITETVIQSVIDHLDEAAGSQVDFIVCSSGVKRAFQQHMSAYRRNIDIMDLKGGYKALSYNGIPILSDRFCPSGTMYLLNTKDFALHQLCDWKWLEGDDGRIMRQVPGKAVYTATLVKYADLICTKPHGQAMLTGITEA